MDFIREHLSPLARECRILGEQFYEKCTGKPLIERKDDKGQVVTVKERSCIDRFKEMGVNEQVETAITVALCATLILCVAIAAEVVLVGFVIAAFVSADVFVYCTSPFVPVNVDNFLGHVKKGMGF